MNRLIHLKENELSNSDNIKEIEITKITVKHAYCTDCGTELVSAGPTMFNPFTMEKQNIHTCEKCGKNIILNMLIHDLFFMMKITMKSSDIVNNFTKFLLK